VAPNATVCGDVRIAEGVRVLFGATVIAEGGSIEIGKNCIILENAVVRSTAKHSTSIGPNSLIGPNAHVVGCTTEESVFIATGAAVLHGAYLEARSEVRINSVVHTRSRIRKDETVPIGWVAVGDPAEILPPNEHEKIWSLQEGLNFVKTVYGVNRAPIGETRMPEISERLSEIYGKHKEDKIL
jgi:carbonic anhydrase/acetyltransferase-like protein (isoleucine patch superfamily)